MFDIFFISYGEPNAETNYLRLKSRFPLAKHVKDITGIQQAHITAAKKSFTGMFWVVDGDAEILDTFNFDYIVNEADKDCVHVWYSRNPINGLEYGYGGVKLLPKSLTVNMDISKPDMTTSISTKFKSMPKVSNITNFNTDPFSTWRSAFRECVKLSSKIINNQVDTETEQRLNVWLTIGQDKPFGEYCINGAREGKKYGIANQNNLNELVKINDYVWLKEYYKNSVI